MNIEHDCYSCRVAKEVLDILWSRLKDEDSKDEDSLGKFWPLIKNINEQADRVCKKCNRPAPKKKHDPEPELEEADNCDPESEGLPFLNTPFCREVDPLDMDVDPQDMDEGDMKREEPEEEEDSTDTTEVVEPMTPPLQRHNAECPPAPKKRSRLTRFAQEA